MTTTEPTPNRIKTVQGTAKEHVKAGAWAALCRLGRGLAGLPADIVWYLGAHDHDAGIAEAAPGDPTTKARILQAQAIRERRLNASVFVGVSLAWCTGGWMAFDPRAGAAVLFLLTAVTVLSGMAAWQNSTTPWGGTIRLSIVLVASIASEWTHLQVGLSARVMTGSYLALVLAWCAYAAGNGTGRDDFPGVEVQRLAEPKTVPASESNAVLALAKGVNVGVQRDGSVDPAAAAGEVAIIGVPGTVGKWTKTHFQLQTKVFADLERSTSPKPVQKIAGVLRRPAGWVFLERVGDESQGVLYVADANPWPTEPVRWRGLDVLEHDAWVPEVIGVDMFTGQPVAIPAAATSDLCGASPGGGKTAWTRREMCLLAADPFVDRVIFDLKGDGALAMFEPACSHYADGCDAATMRDLAEWLEWFKGAEEPRRKAIMKRLVKAGLAPDAKLTREIARNPEHELPLMVVVVDEVQDGCSHKTYGEAISDGLTHVAKQGRSIGVRLKIRTQKPTDDRTGIPSALNSMLPTRIAGRAEDYQVSKATLLTSKLRADHMPEGPEGLFYLRLLGGRVEKVLAEYVDANQAQDYVRRVQAYQRTIGLAPAVKAEAPKVLLEMRRLLTERGGRMPSSEMAAAMATYGLITIPDDDPTGKTVEQLRQEALADLVRPHGVRTRPDASDGNRMAYWLDREDRRYGQVGVGPAIERIEKGQVSPGVAGNGYSGSPDGSRTGSRRLRVV